MVAGMAFLAEGLIGYLYTDIGLSVGVMVLGTAIVTPCIFSGRLIFSNYAGQRLPQTRLVLVGSSPTLTHAITVLDRGAPGRRTSHRRFL